MTSPVHHVALLGGGTIGLSMLALHLRRPDTKVTLYDPRPDIETQLRSTLPTFLTIPSTSPDTLVDTLLSNNRLTIAQTLESALESATIIQEQSPETLPSKQALWASVATSANENAHLWSSSSGIPATKQAAIAGPTVARRLVVVHPFNPPHVMPLIEIVPGLETADERVDFVKRYFSEVPGPEGIAAESASALTKHYRPVVLHKEVPGFVGNRLAFALLREACYLVGEGVVEARDLDTLIKASLGPRWAGSGVFESYHAGGGEGGIGAFLEKLSSTIGEVWGDLGQIDVSVSGQSREQKDEAWRDVVVKQTEEAYGPSVSADDRKKKETLLNGVIGLQKQDM